MIIKITPKIEMVYHGTDKIIPVRYLNLLPNNGYIATENIEKATEIEERFVDTEIKILNMRWGKVADFEAMGSVKV